MLYKTYYEVLCLYANILFKTIVFKTSTRSVLQSDYNVKLFMELILKVSLFKKLNYEKQT